MLFYLALNFPCTLVFSTSAYLLDDLVLAFVCFGNVRFLNGGEGGNKNKVNIVPFLYLMISSAR